MGTLSLSKKIVIENLSDIFHACPSQKKLEKASIGEAPMIVLKGTVGYGFTFRIAS